MPFITTKIKVPKGKRCIGCIHIKPCGSSFYCGAFAYEDAVSLFPLESSMKKHRHCLNALEEAKTQSASPTNNGYMAALKWLSIELLFIKDAEYRQYILNELRSRLNSVKAPNCT